MKKMTAQIKQREQASTKDEQTDICMAPLKEHIDIKVFYIKMIHIMLLI